MPDRARHGRRPQATTAIRSLAGAAAFEPARRRRGPAQVNVLEYGPSELILETHEEDMRAYFDSGMRDER